MPKMRKSHDWPLCAYLRNDDIGIQSHPISSLKCYIYHFYYCYCYHYYFKFDENKIRVIVQTSTWVTLLKEIVWNFFVFFFRNRQQNALAAFVSSVNFSSVLFHFILFSKCADPDLAIIRFTTLSSLFIYSFFIYFILFFRWSSISFTVNLPVYTLHWWSLFYGKN